jgi:hypothetical protein
VDRIRGRFRCSIAAIMATVVLVALDCIAIRTPLSGRSPTAGMLLLGGLPTANILAAGLLTLLSDRSWRCVSRPWLVGFEVVGWTVLLLYASCACSHADQTDAEHDDTGRLGHRTRIQSDARERRPAADRPDQARGAGGQVDRVEAGTPSARALRRRVGDPRQARDVEAHEFAGCRRRLDLVGRPAPAIRGTDTDVFHYFLLFLHQALEQAAGTGES